MYHEFLFARAVKTIIYLNYAIKGLSTKLYQIAMSKIKCFKFSPESDPTIRFSCNFPDGKTDNCTNFYVPNLRYRFKDKKYLQIGGLEWYRLSLLSYYLESFKKMV